MSAIPYQPTEIEIAALWARKSPGSAGYDMMCQAENMLRHINQHFVYRDGRFETVGKNRVIVTATPAGTTCTCKTYREQPFVPRRYGDVVISQVIRHCPHTLAITGYIRILIGRYQAVKNQCPQAIQAQEIWRNGEYQLANLATYMAFGAWLAQP